MIGTIQINTDKSSEEIACAWLLKQKGRKLSNTNVECFVDGFKIARGITESFSESIPRIIKELRGIYHQRDEEAGYSGRYFTDNDLLVIEEAKKLADRLEELQLMIAEFNNICHKDEKL